MFNFYKNNLENGIDSNIDDKIPSKNNFLQPSKLNASIFQQTKAFLLLSQLFGNSTRTTNNKRNNLNIFLLGNLSLKLPSSILPNDLLNLLLNFNDRKL